MTGLRAPAFPEEPVRARARIGPAAAFPPTESYGHTLYGARTVDPADRLESMRLVPPVFMPWRLEKLIETGREPTHRDVLLDTTVGGFSSPLPVYLSAFGSTAVASGDPGRAAGYQAGRLGIPIVVGENVVPVNGYRPDGSAVTSLLRRIEAYATEVPAGRGGVVVQQCTEDADAEVWNLVHSDPAARHLVDTGRLAFELKIGQGAKPGLGGMTLVDPANAGRLVDRYLVDPLRCADGSAIRCASPGTFTEEILRHQIRLMRNNYPGVRVWVKLHPGRDVAAAAALAWDAGADAVTVDGADGGTGCAPTAALDHVGLPLAECLRRIGRTTDCLLVSGRMWEGSRAVKALALGATAVGLGRAALVAVDEDPQDGLIRLVECLALELRLLISALGKYAGGDLDHDDVWPVDPVRVPIHEQ